MYALRWLYRCHQSSKNTQDKPNFRLDFEASSNTLLLMNGKCEGRKGIIGKCWAMYRISGDEVFNSVSTVLMNGKYKGRKGIIGYYRILTLNSEQTTEGILVENTTMVKYHRGTLCSNSGVVLTESEDGGVAIFIIRWIVVSLVWGALINILNHTALVRLTAYL
ncbi:hypothetical protein F5J12DRAFT_784746 [Pisolithus orientalis]|uniref:uncharacterized protein n=1 Tax=Pisolithus orientalis TaxID=936130 RepID=UPI0022254444|nr:uncharacterized protein F5J12DRAFT_784746 [Pisolithus orientalis]KAI5999431.1 hypothetical protein F5J12DRAFT_784746 [Pisolithus orientalis]